MTPAQQEMFQQMPHADQRHCLDIAHTLQERGHTHPALFQAALLHDVAKSEGVSLWHRVAVVLLKAFAPGLLTRLAEDRPGSWRYGFYVHRHHPERGAVLAQATGCDPLAVDLIRRHQESQPRELSRTPVNALLSALQEADEAN
ncbi:MAG: hypothetical protein A2Z04_03740 [Chloroflexi bacterium RBG_16_57_9]|nr:MAG: hypothetical protein A2Z04_03740 [Chloroflexi bacterium RBG_16_57_9]